MSDETPQEPNIGELLSRILKNQETVMMRLASLEEIVSGMDVKLDGLTEDVSVLRSQMDIFAADIHQIRAEARRLSARVATIEAR